jgi:hypothetical protein
MSRRSHVPKPLIEFSQSLGTIAQELSRLGYTAIVSDGDNTTLLAGGDFMPVVLGMCRISAHAQTLVEQAMRASPIPKEYQDDMRTLIEGFKRENNNSVVLGKAILGDGTTKAKP